MSKEKWYGHLAIITTNCIFGLNTPIAKSFVPEWISPYALTFVRMLFATLIFWIIGCFFQKEKIASRDLIVIFLGALFGLVGAQLTFAHALLYTSPVNISIIAAMTPVAVMLLAALILREPISLKKAIGVLIGASGALLIILQSTVMSGSKEGSLLGNMLCVANIATYALYLVITRPISQRYTPITLMKWMFLFSAILSAPLGFRPLLEAKIFSAETNIYALLRLSYTVVLATGIAYLLVPMGLKRIRPTTASMYNNLQPILASAIAIFMGQDLFTWDKPLAACLVFIGVYLVTQSKAKEEIGKR